MAFYNNQAGYGRAQQPPMRTSQEQHMMRSRCTHTTPLAKVEDRRRTHDTQSLRTLAYE